MKHENTRIETVSHDQIFGWMGIIAGGLFITLIVSKWMWGLLFSSAGAGLLDVSSYIALTLTILLVELYVFAGVGPSLDEME